MQNFYIKQGATQPVLLMKVNRDNNFSYEKFHTALENSTITFSMYNIETNIFKIAKKRGGIIFKENNINCVVPDNEYYIYYKFTENDTNMCGKFIGEFKIEFYDTVETDITGTFVGPIHDDLYITIKPSLFID